MPEPATPPANGTQSRIFDPARSQPAAPRTTAAPTVPAGDDPPGSGIERDPNTGRFLKPGFTAALVGRARKLGLTEQDLADFDDPADLRAEVNERAAEERFARMFNAREAAGRGNGTGNAIETPTATVPAFEPQFNEETVNPDVAEVIRGMHAHYQGVIDGLVKRLEKVEGLATNLGQRETGRVIRTLDKAFQKYPDVFGAGSRKDVKEGSSQFILRMAAEAYHNERGGDPEQLEENIDTFVAEKFGKRRGKPRRPADDQDLDDEDDQDLDDEAADEAEQWNRGVLNRPTQAGAREAAAGREKAVQGIKRRMAPVRSASDARTPRGIYLPHGRRATGQPER